MRQSHPKYPNCHILASICPFDTISSPFIIYRIRSFIFIRCKRLWDGSFWLNFGPSALDRASMVPQIPKLSYLGFYLSVFPHLFTIPHLYNPCKYFYVLEWAVLAAFGTFFIRVSMVCPKYTNCHISAYIYPFDPISSPFLICRIGSSILMLCKWIQDGLTEFWFFCTVFVCQLYPKRGIDAARSCGHRLREC